MSPAAPPALQGRASSTQHPAAVRGEECLQCALNSELHTIPHALGALGEGSSFIFQLAFIFFSQPECRKQTLSFILEAGSRGISRSLLLMWGGLTRALGCSSAPAPGPGLGLPEAARSPMSLSARWPRCVPSSARPLSDLQCSVANGRENKGLMGSGQEPGGPMPPVPLGRRGRASAPAPASPFISLPPPPAPQLGGHRGRCCHFVPPLNPRSRLAAPWRRSRTHSSARDDPSVRPPAPPPPPPSQRRGLSPGHRAAPAAPSIGAEGRPRAGPGGAIAALSPGRGRPPPNPRGPRQHHQLTGPRGLPTGWDGMVPRGGGPRASRAGPPFLCL